MPMPPAPSIRPSLNAGRPLTPARSVLWLSAVAVMVSAGLLALLGVQEHGRVYRQATADTLGSARQLAEHAEKVLSIHALALQNVQWTYDVLGWDRMSGTPLVHRWLTSLADQAPEVQSYWLMDAAGQVRVNSFTWPAPSLDVSDREYFRAHQEGADPDRVHVGAPLLGRVRPDVFFTLSRRLADADGNFAGVAQVSLMPEYFSRFYGTIARASKTTIMLVRDDGTVLARFPQLGSGADFGRVPELLAGPRAAGTLETDGPADGVRRLYAHVPLEKLPVQVVYGVAVDNMQAEWVRRMRGSLLLVLAGLALLVPFVLLAFRNARRAELAHDALLSANSDLERRVADRTAHLDKALADLSSSEEWLRYAQEAGGIGTWELQAGSNALIVSDQVNALWGLPAGTQLGLERMQDPIHAEDRPGVQQALEETWDGRRPRLELEFRVVRPDGTVRWMLSRAEVRGAADGSPEAMTGVVFDITDLKRALTALQESELRSTLAQEAGGVGTWDWDLVNGAVHWSPTYRRIWGVPDGVKPSFDGLIAGVTPEDRARVETAVAATLAGEAPLDQEFRIMRPDGSRRWLLLRGELLRDKTGRGSRMTGICRDMTDRKEAEERQLLLMREVDHRAKNALAVAQAVVRLSRANTVEQLVAAVEGRISALARAHSLLATAAWSGADLNRLVQDELAPFAEPGHVLLEGPAVQLIPDVVQSIGLILHELATNAAKHGALSVPAGVVRVTWTLDGTRLRLTWQEEGGPPAVEPKRKGFGSTLLSMVVRHQLQGTTASNGRTRACAACWTCPT
ncbi:PAS domain-containing protein [Aerophototrophica crusticola]|uniref:histidine kinase n=1 Tax=Aerophototrophica crusticola TaxID=1709002 RepID=A0A858R791_9PROT|nr:PAS domain-containing protein [Rhodospirillaceae bacterium B3]